MANQVSTSPLKLDIHPGWVHPPYQEYPQPGDAQPGRVNSGENIRYIGLDEQLGAIESRVLGVLSNQYIKKLFVTFLLFFAFFVSRTYLGIVSKRSYLYEMGNQ